MRSRAVVHLAALTLAVLIACWVQTLSVGHRAVSWLSRHDFFSDATPYFPGLANLGTHQIFSQHSRAKKKIVFLGASAIDAIGCDFTWHRPLKGQEPNVHSSCSIAGQMNELLRAQGRDDWQAFDLARNGSKLTVMLYVYAQIAALKPDIVVFGDSFSYYLWENADADVLSNAQYGLLEDFYGSDPQTRDMWHSYLDTLRTHGWKGEAGSPTGIGAAIDEAARRPPASTTLGEVLARGLLDLRHAALAQGMPRPVAQTAYRDWTVPSIAHHAFDNPDPGFGYFQGVDLINIKQRESGGKLFVYFSPQWDLSFDPDYVAGLDHVFGDYLRAHTIPYVSLVGMRMQPIVETYDGNHHSVAGNRRIAAAVLDKLMQDGLIP